jgi:CheY-like chemotaxis protein
MAETAKIVVLVADDEPSTLALLSRHLRGKGYSVLEASDGDQAWELAHEHLPHLVILDVMMPGMSGWEVCRKIREAVSLAHTGVIMLTGIGERLNEMTSPLYGADAHVDKPFEFSDLDEKIEDTLEHRRTTMGRPDHADELEGSIAVQPEPEAARAKPLVKAKPKAAPAAAKGGKKAVGDDEDLEEEEDEDMEDEELDDDLEDEGDEDKDEGDEDEGDEDKDLDEGEDEADEDEDEADEDEDEDEDEAD